MAEKANGSAPKKQVPGKEKILQYAKRIWGVDEELASEKGAYMKRCQDLQATKKEIFKDAAKQGIPTKVFKLALDALDLDAKAKAKRGELAGDAEREAAFDKVAEAVGFDSTPLGKAASGGAKDKTPEAPAAKPKPASTLSRGTVTAH